MGFLTRCDVRTAHATLSESTAAANDSAPQLIVPTSRADCDEERALLSSISACGNRNKDYSVVCSLV